MERHGTQGGQVKSVERAMEIVETVMEMEGAGVSELAAELDMAKSTVHGYLATLHRLGYLVKEGERYQIGTRFLRFGEYSRTRKPEYGMAAKKVTELAEETEERSQFVIEELGRGVFLYRESGAHAVETGSGTGKRMYLHSTSAGKAILAHLPDETVDGILDRWGLPAVTPATITDEGTLRDELADIRDRGFALNREENIEGLHAVGVPVQLQDGTVIGALSISGPTHRLKGEYLLDDLPDLLLGTANELELNITYS
jgi:DNA-binding IclR family transcriptional regulator